jgi:hypothetical protein
MFGGLLVLFLCGGCSPGAAAGLAGAALSVPTWGLIVVVVVAVGGILYYKRLKKGNALLEPVSVLAAGDAPAQQIEELIKRAEALLERLKPELEKLPAARERLAKAAEDRKQKEAEVARIEAELAKLGVVVEPEASPIDREQALRELKGLETALGSEVTLLEDELKGTHPAAAAYICVELRRQLDEIRGADTRAKLNSLARSSKNMASPKNSPWNRALLHGLLGLSSVSEEGSTQKPQCAKVRGVWLKMAEYAEKKKELLAKKPAGENPFAGLKINPPSADGSAQAAKQERRGKRFANIAKRLGVNYERALVLEALQNAVVLARKEIKLLTADIKNQLNHTAEIGFIAPAEKLFDRIRDAFEATALRKAVKYI